MGVQVFRKIFLAVCLWTAAGMVLSGVASAGILGHRAVYNLKLIDAKEGADITAVDGRMALEVADACNGHTLNQRIVLQIYDTRGSVITSDFRMTSWESEDGHTFRFNTREEVNGRELSGFDGTADLNGGDGGGTVTLTKGDGDSRTLKRGTVFPTAHTRALIARAESGENLLAIDVFDGSKGLGSLFGTSAFIGAPLATGDYKAEHQGAEILGALSSWPVQVAYFPYVDDGDTRADLPEFEIGYRIFSNGVVSDLKVDYGEFEISGTLDELEALPEPGC